MWPYLFWLLGSDHIAIKPNKYVPFSQESLNSLGRLYLPAELVTFNLHRASILEKVFFWGGGAKNSATKYVMRSLVNGALPSDILAD